MGRRTSARVGVGLVIMLSSMLVATMTGLPRRRQPCTMRDCQKGTCTETFLSRRLTSGLCFTGYIAAARTSRYYSTLALGGQEAREGEREAERGGVGAGPRGRCRCCRLVCDSTTSRCMQMHLLPRAARRAGRRGPPRRRLTASICGICKAFMSLDFMSISAIIRIR